MTLTCFESVFVSTVGVLHLHSAAFCGFRITWDLVLEDEEEEESREVECLVVKCKIFVELSCLVLSGIFC
jgi:hypothetical protein